VIKRAHIASRHWINTKCVVVIIVRPRREFQQMSSTSQESRAMASWKYIQHTVCFTIKSAAYQCESTPMWCHLLRHHAYKWRTLVPDPGQVTGHARDASVSHAHARHARVLICHQYHGCGRLHIDSRKARAVHGRANQTRVTLLQPTRVCQCRHSHGYQ